MNSLYRPRHVYNLYRSRPISAQMNPPCTNKSYNNRFMGLIQRHLGSHKKSYIMYLFINIH